MAVMTSITLYWMRWRVAVTRENVPRGRTVEWTHPTVKGAGSAAMRLRICAKTRNPSPHAIILSWIIC